MDRLVSLEEALSQIAAQQTDFQALEPLLGNVDSVLRFDSNASLYRKKLSDLSLKSESVRKYAASLQAKVALFSNSADESVKELSRKREKDLRNLEAKVAAIEGTYRSLQGEGAGIVKKVKAELEAERATFNERFEAKLRLETESVRENLEKQKQQTRKDVETVKEVVKSTTKTNAAYVKKSADALKSALPKASRTDDVIEAGKKTVIEEVKSRLASSANDVKNDIIKQTQSAMDRFHGMMAEVVAGMQEMKEASGPPAAIEKQVRGLLDELYPSLNMQARNVTQATAPIEAKLKKVKEKHATEDVKTVIRDLERDTQAFATALRSIETRMSECVTGLESAFQLLPGMEGTLTPLKVEILRKFQREYGMKRPITEKSLASAKTRVNALNTIGDKLRALPPPPPPVEEVKLSAPEGKESMHDDSKASDQSSSKA